MKTNHDLESIFAQAVELADPSHQGAFLDEACAGDLPLRNRVGRLLTANQRAVSFMSEPAALLSLPDEADRDVEVGRIGERPGDCVGRYKLLQEIGEGGMGVVFMAEQTEPVHRKVALKIVKPGLDTKEVIARFESERQALALMSHANIARVLDAGASQQGRPYFVMELVKGIPITEYCNEAKLTPRKRLELFVPICRAIQHAHQKGVIHRDIKPSNVLVTLVDGQPLPKVIDFGIAKATDHRLTEKTLFTRFGEFIGTPAYMSPEQATISGMDVDTRTDVYSLGALLYELLVGTPPFDKEQLKPLTRDELRRFIREETPRQPSDAIRDAQSTAGPAQAEATTIAESRGTTLQELKSQLHGELDWIVMRALEKERDRRYETASAFADDVMRYIHNETVVARPATLAYRCRKFASRHRLAIGALAVVGLTLFAATAFSGWMAVRAMRAQENESRETDTLRDHVEFINRALFGQADPLVELNRKVDLRLVLDRASQDLANQPIDRPTVEAAIRGTIGRAYLGLGEYREALQHLARSHQICKAEYGAAHRKTIDIGNHLARVHLAAAQFGKAKELLEQQLVAGQTLPSEDPLLLSTKMLIAASLEADGEYAEAEKLLREVWQKRRASLGDRHADTLKAMADVGLVLQTQQRSDEALSLLRDAHEGLLSSNDPWHPSTLKVTSALASHYAALSDLDRAEKIYLATLPKLESRLGKDHPQTLTTKHRLALLRMSNKEFGDAESILMEVLEAQKQQLGDAHPATLDTMRNLALLRKAQGRFSDAESLLLAELEGRRHAVGEKHDFDEECAVEPRVLLLGSSPIRRRDSLLRTTDSFEFCE